MNYNYEWMNEWIKKLKTETLGMRSRETGVSNATPKVLFLLKVEVESDVLWGQRFWNANPNPETQYLLTDFLRDIDN